MLLKDSQYVVETATDAQINTVVSGALDRLHSETDPCVKFDADQKLWMYLLELLVYVIVCYCDAVEILASASNVG